MPQIGLVLPGGGARGAYEAGALSVLIPALAARGERVEIVCGTSVGGINAAVVAAVAAQPPARQAETLLEHWRSVRKASVISPVIGVGTGLGLLRLAGEVLELPGLRAASLLDPSPLARSLDRWIDWDALRANVAGGAMHAVCVVATSLERGLPVGFVDFGRGTSTLGPRDPLRPHPPRPARARVRRDPAALPAGRGDRATGRVRALRRRRDAAQRADRARAGARRGPRDRGRVRAAGEPRALGSRGLPRLADVAANALDGLLLDQVAHDVRRMLAVNAFFAESPATGTSRAARAYREAHGRPPYRRISYALVAPSRRGEIGALAEAVFEGATAACAGSARRLRPAARPLGGGRAQSRRTGVVVLFDEVFIERLLQAAAPTRGARWTIPRPSGWPTPPPGFEPADVS